MEITIKINGRMTVVEVSAEVAECMDAGRRKAENLSHERRRHWDGREFDEYIVAAEGLLPCQYTPEDLTCQQETLDEIFSVLDTCTPTQRERFLLFALDGYNYTEISRICDCSRVAVYESIKSGGILLLGDHFPHTPQTIATCTRHQIGTVERGLKIFLQLGLIEILTDGAYYMTDIQLLIGQSSTEGERKKRERSRLQRQKLLPSGGVDICPPNSRVDKCPPILEKEKDIELEIDREIEGGEIAPAVLGRYQNIFLTSQEQAELQTEFPGLWREYAERLSEYMASTGKQYRSHAATIRRWIADDRRKAAPPARDREYSVKDGDTV